ncbi:uncharacterized protein PV09_01635 [Verruconis gallopava]|uniref:Cellular morphogenesis protein n=1 Tax=Verruconis gallopava TaxID=253628 RepID=A0A0D1Z3Y7_9PEZI|nr:uncharacterized protein PV09_01635 [Verruconis gallopava]KIW07697.1 hypothetical protein PV09_01635 [Verruconis gallopava]
MRTLFALPARLAALVFTASSSLAFSFQQAPSSNLDISQLGRVGVAGDFDAVSLYQWVGQSQSSGSQNGSSSLLSRFPYGTFANLDVSDGMIQAMCPFVLQDGTLAGVVVGGNFTSVGGVESNGVALFNTTTAAIQPLQGLNGSVSALYCDQNSSTVYMGGSFTSGNSSNAIGWRTSNWISLPFDGFNGPVNAITKSPNGTFIFGGSFDGLGNATTPEVRDSQVIPLSSANISATASSTQDGFSDPRNIICKTGSEDGPGNTWLLADNAAGTWTADFEFGFIPTKLRLYNTNEQGRGTKTFRFVAQPINGIMNFSYVDPSSGQEMFCDARCPLPENNKTAQDFRFVNMVGMNSFSIDISEFYGAGAGLAGIELFEDDIYAFAINDFNAGQCAGVSTTSAISTTTGPWEVTPSHQSNSEYLTAQLDGTTTTDSASVVFEPNIVQTGNYSITIFTPGCIGDGTCSTRGRVNITGVMSNPSGTGPSVPISTEIWQTNNYDKYDEIYLGRVDVVSGSFRPSVTLTPSAGQNGPLTVVAQKIRASLQVSTGGLNGLFEYNPNEATASTDFSSSVVDTAGNSLGSTASISALAVENQTIYVAGNFSSNISTSVFAITDKISDLGEGGLNGAVSSMTLNNSVLYFAGSFNGTKDGSTAGLTGVASFNITAGKWVPLGAGINGNADFVVPFLLNTTASNDPEVAIAVSGNFDSINAFGDNQAKAAAGFAIWLPGHANWLENLNVTTIFLQGVLITGTNVPGNPPLFAGQVSSFELAANGSFELTGTGNTIQQFPVSITDTPSQTKTSAKAKRAVVDQSTNGVVAGLFYNDNGLNLTIYGGHFTTTATNGSTITNLAIVNGSDGNAVSGFAAGVDSSSVVAALGTSGTSLFVGGNLTGNVNGREVGGLVMYDLVANDYASPQPASLQGSSATVNAIAPQPSTTLVYVGGDFQSAGSFNCPALCVFDTSRSQWISPGGNDVSGSVTSMSWVSNYQLAIVGNLTVGSNTSTVMIYDTKINSGQFLDINGPAGTLTAITSGSSDGTQYWVGGTNVDGSPLLQKYNGTWTAVEPALGQGSVIQGLQVFTTTQNHGKSDLLNRNLVLMALGSLNVPNFGNASAAIFNGTTWTPYALTGSTTGNGSLRQVFVENPFNFFKSSRRYLAIGFVVLIGLAISLGIIFLLVIAGIFAERYRRKRDGYVPAPQNMPQDKYNNINRVPPEHLFGSMNPNSRPSGPL